MASSLDLSPFPPAPVTWAYNALDTFCEPLGCGQWRQRVPEAWTAEGAWFWDEFRLGRSVSELMPNLMTYPEFLEESRSPVSLQSLKVFLFETSSTSLADLTTPSSLILVFLLALILRRVKRFLMPMFSEIGRRSGRHTHGKEWERDNEIRIVKFGEYVFRLLFHACISIAGIVYFWDKEWWKDTKALFLGYPHQAIAPGMIWYYLVQCAYNVDAMFSLLEMSFTVSWGRPASQLQSSSSSSSSSKLSFFYFPIRVGWSQKRRGDFREMCIHHVVTNLLIIGSSFFRFTRVGSMVFLVHDISDVPVDLSKLANFLKWKASTATCFAIMVLVWCMTRLGVLPFFIFRSVLYESWMVTSSGVIDPVYYVHYRPFFAVLMGLLILLHLFWFTMFLEMGWILVFKGETHDLSEHKKGETQGALPPPSSSSQQQTNGKKAQ